MLKPLIFVLGGFAARTSYLLFPGTIPPAGRAGSCTRQCLFPNINQFQQLTVVHFLSEHLPAIRRKQVSGETLFLIRLFTLVFPFYHPSVHLRTFSKLIFSTKTLGFCCISKQFSPKTHRYLKILSWI